jgi:hypothetical protein
MGITPGDLTQKIEWLIACSPHPIGKYKAQKLSPNPHTGIGHLVGESLVRYRLCYVNFSSKWNPSLCSEFTGRTPTTQTPE